jgi:hypothetical protein
VRGGEDVARGKKNIPTIKGARADNALALRAIRGGLPIGVPLSEDQLAQHRAIKERAMELNKRGAV